MEKYTVIVSSFRAKKDGSFNIFGGQGYIRNEFKNLVDAKKHAEKIRDDIECGKVPKDLKTTNKTAFVEILGCQPYSGLTNIFTKDRIRYDGAKKVKKGRIKNENKNRS